MLDHTSDKSMLSIKGGKCMWKENSSQRLRPALYWSGEVTASESLCERTKLLPTTRLQPVLSYLFDLALNIPHSCSAVFAVYKKECIQLSYRTSRFVERFVHLVNVWIVAKILGCGSRIYGFESGWNNVFFIFFVVDISTHSTNVEYLCFFPKCVAIVATIFS